MKKIIASVLVIVCILNLSSCSQKENEDILYLGINAVIVEIDTDDQIVYVVDSGAEKVFGARCGIDCKQLIIDQEIVYVDCDTGEVSFIQFADLAVGDEVVINAYKSQLASMNDGVIEVKQIQLAA